jgi:dTDP-4-amino-4,6-dideoxygalactose transaminase
MDAIITIANKHGLAVIEDNAHGLFGRWKGRNLGSFGRFATLSFHETKNFTCGEGGAIVINDAEDIERAEILREKGTNRARFFRGQVDKYTWVGLGSSYLPSDVLAAILCAQLEQRESIQARRMEIWQRYREGLAGWAGENSVVLPDPPPEADHTGHIFHILLPSLESRGQLIKHLGERSILAVFHYQPLHLSPMGHDFGGRPGTLPVTENVSDRLLRLPLYYSFSPAEQDQVIESILAFKP